MKRRIYIFFLILFSLAIFCQTNSKPELDGLVEPNPDSFISGDVWFWETFVDCMNVDLEPYGVELEVKIIHDDAAYYDIEIVPRAIIVEVTGGE